jgi:hypothetical protein
MSASQRQFTLLRAASFALVALISACATVQAPVEERAEPPAAAQSRSAAASEPKAPRSPFTEPPGVLFVDVTQDNIATTICVNGWTATVRPSTSYTQGVKRKLLREAGIDPAQAINYELDHFVPLALGGHPRSLDNLWLQSWDGDWSAKVKDRLERKLQVMVCAGQIALSNARAAIQKNWKAAYLKYVAPTLSRVMETGEEEVVD